MECGSSLHRWTKRRASGMRAPAQQLAVLSGHGEVLNHAAYSPDGTHIVTASRQDRADLGCAQRRAARGAFRAWQCSLFRSYSPDGTRIVTASSDKTARIWDARTGAQLACSPAMAIASFSAAYSPDGTRIVTASDDKTARIWDAHAGAQLAVLSGHGGYRLVRRLFARRHAHRHRLVRQDRAHLGCALGHAAAVLSGQVNRVACSELFARRHAHRHRV